MGDPKKPLKGLIFEVVSAVSCDTCAVKKPIRIRDERELGVDLKMLKFKILIFIQNSHLGQIRHKPTPKVNRIEMKSVSNFGLHL